MSLVLILPLSGRETLERKEPLFGNKLEAANLIQSKMFNDIQI